MQNYNYNAKIRKTMITINSNSKFRNLNNNKFRAKSNVIEQPFL